jgi:hypothetical protein
MAEFKINKFAYTWKGNWTSGTAYIKDDIVRYGGKSFVCIRQHTADSDFYSDLYYVFPGDTSQSPAWVKMTDGFSYRETWTATTKYNLGDIVQYGGRLYLVIEDHTSTTIFDDNIGKHSVYAEGSSWNNNWAPATRYGIGDLVKYNGIVYRCITGHTSATTSLGLESDQAKWSTYYEGIEYKGAYTSGTRYRLNDLVKFGGSILRCTQGHTSTSTIDNAYWTIDLPGNNPVGDWVVTTQYAIGDIVKHGGYMYVAKTNHTGISPGDEDLGSANWTIISKGQNFRGAWDAEATYKTGDVVQRGGQVYVATLDSSTDGSSLDYLEAGSWEVIVPGENWRNYWSSNAEYAVGDVVIFDGSSYRCSYAHTADSQNYPGDNGSGFVYWTLLLQSGPNIGLRQRGDLLTYDLQRGLAGDTSTFGPTAVEIGTKTHLLTINDEDSLYYKAFNELARALYVAPNGFDEPGRGHSIFNPFKTIRYACERAEELGDSVETNIYVRTGKYQEILPIIVPSKTALQGEEVRGVIVEPNEPIAALANDDTYTLDILSRMREILPDIIKGDLITPVTGNNIDQVVLSGLSDDATGVTLIGLVDDVSDYINFKFNNGQSNPTVTGSNDPSTDSMVINATLQLEANIEFLQEEAVAFMNYYYPNYTFDSNLCRRDIDRYIRAFVYDLTYTGNYKSIMAARYYCNAVTGSNHEDMFYVRNATGIRNMTLQGLVGELSEELYNGLYRKPTGGSYVSLDPGWGPADERCWITSRSCYVQNVATFGYGATGQKIDGALHNGGNKSIVSNDFTQVISDGIGAWVLNDGRAELVSVFTYYSHVGYLAENGGKIRATNGNNSYGDFGSLAVGNDPLETPKYGSVNNRNNEATVISAFAGEVNDFILTLEFENAGQNYTQASYSIIGSGVGASVIQDDFRDKAVFYPKLINPQDSSLPGGSGYIVVQNNAQSGGPTSITIASNDSNEESAYLGMRIVITSGVGTGQYGIITGYNTLTKVVTVKRESDGVAGWDHVVPGYPIAPLLINSTTYRIEALVTFAAPPYITQAITIPVSTYWSNIVYGETRESYTNVLGSAPSGTTIDIPVSVAAWNVVKNGRTYTVTIGGSAGAGYALGQTVILTGDDLGGITPDNDITITITGISNDSTNSITAYTYEGIAASGRFVMIPSTGTSGIASTDGINWVSSTLPASRAWKGLAAGGNRFVTVGYNSASVAQSTDGKTWTERSIASRFWNAVAYGDGVFVAVAGNLNSSGRSTDLGTSWTVSNNLPTLGDSTINEWVDVTYGKGMFVAIANSNNVYAMSNDGGATWTGGIMDVIDDSSQKDWISIAYGRDRFVAISSQGDIAYSFDTVTWYPASMPTQDGSTSMNWKSIKYGNGVFLAVCDTGSKDIFGDPTSGPTNFIATSEDGIVWTGREVSSFQNWIGAAYGNPDITYDDSTVRDVGNNTPTWVLISGDQSNVIDVVKTGARAKGRVILASGRVGGIKLWDPGSGYVSGGPEVTVYDPNRAAEPFFDNRIGDGVLGQPSWLNRGSAYKTSTTRVTISGDGFADVIPANRYITISGMTQYPTPGAQLRFDGNPNLYTAVIVTPITGTTFDGLTARFQIQPYFDVDNGPVHNTFVEIRERYSQCRITGHDFLDIGTGNFLETNYPELYSTGDFFKAPENEIAETDGGRVFYTSTDQDGNFRAGELFAVEQATGIVTISADYFDLNGLSELRLGGVRLGGTGTVIREFSTDPLFSADSNNVIPTQRAIKAYLANRLSVGGADIATASFIAGTVKVGPGEIRSTINGHTVFPQRMDFYGPDATGRNGSVTGTILAQTLFYRSFKHR